MHTLDLNTWPRRGHFKLFQSFDYPHFSLTAPVEVSALYAAVKAANASFTIAVTYALSRAANAMPEFRWRIRGEQVVEHDTVHPAPTVLGEGDLFSYCAFPYISGYAQFADGAQRAQAQVKAHPTLEDEPGRDDWLFMTAIPWVAFTSMMHPIHMHPTDSVPRLAWGRHTLSATQRNMPLGVQVHHALMDGVHVGRYYQSVQALLDAPDWLDS